MSNVRDIRDFGDFGDALYAHKQRLNALYAAIYGFGEHQCHADDPMHSGIVQLCRDVSDNAEKLQEECERLIREDGIKSKEGTERAKARIREILMRDDNVIVSAADLPVA